MTITAPERIWDFWPLDGGEPVLWRKPCPFPHHGEAECFEYVRLDLHAAVVAERDQLKERIAFFENASKAYEEICDNRQREIDSLKRKLGYD